MSRRDDERPTRVVLMTPTGRGAVATLLVKGPRATDFVAQLLSTPRGDPLEQRPVDEIMVGRWGGPTGEEVVVARRSAERIEVHCHGGAAAAARIIDDLTQLGCAVATWQECLSDEQLDPIAAAAQVALAAAPTERTATILFHQLSGALRCAVDEILASLRAAAPASAERQLNELLRFAALGRHLVKPWRVILAGPPNVGKSSLINALVGYERAIVHATPGTTRDVVTAVTALDGWPVELSDTAGLRASDDPIEAAGVERAQQQMVRADCVLLVFDTTQPWTADDEQLLATWRDALVVRNKCDLVTTARTGDIRSPVRGCSPHPTLSPEGRGVIPTSARTGQGLDLLQRQIIERLIPGVPPPGAAVPFTESQVECLAQTLRAVERGDLPVAGELLGQFA